MAQKSFGITTKVPKGRSGWIQVNGRTDSDICEVLGIPGKACIVELSDEREYVALISELERARSKRSYLPNIYKIVRRGDGIDDDSSTLRKVRSKREIELVLLQYVQDYVDSSQ